MLWNPVGFTLIHFADTSKVTSYARVLYLSLSLLSLSRSFSHFCLSLALSFSHFSFSGDCIWCGFMTPHILHPREGSTRATLGPGLMLLMCACICVCVRACVHVHICACIWVCVCVCVCVCVSIPTIMVHFLLNHTADLNWWNNIMALA